MEHDEILGALAFIRLPVILVNPSTVYLMSVCAYNIFVSWMQAKTITPHARTHTLKKFS